MKSRILIVVSALITTLLLVFGINYLLSLHKVTLSLAKEVSSITVYNKNDKEVKRISVSSNLLLHEGAYYIVPEGENLAKDKIEFVVKEGDTTLEVNPPYTEEYLAALFKQQEPAIQDALSNKYPSLIEGYTLDQGTLYKRGEWFGGLLKPKVTDRRDQRAPYRAILNKKDGVWTVIRRPEYILTSSRYTEVPIDVLREVNAIVGEPENL